MWKLVWAQRLNIQSYLIACHICCSLAISAFWVDEWPVRSRQSQSRDALASLKPFCISKAVGSCSSAELCVRLVSLWRQNVALASSLDWFSQTEVVFSKRTRLQDERYYSL
jgi:hypothetical protein